MLGASLNVIMHHQACLLLVLLAGSLLKPDKSSAPFSPLSDAHAHTLIQYLSCQHPSHPLTNKQTTHHLHNGSAKIAPPPKKKCTAFF